MTFSFLFASVWVYFQKGYTDYKIFSADLSYTQTLVLLLSIKSTRISISQDIPALTHRQILQLAKIPNADMDILDLILSQGLVGARLIRMAAPAAQDRGSVCIFHNVNELDE